MERRKLDCDIFFLAGGDGLDLSTLERFVIGIIDALNNVYGCCDATDLEFAGWLRCSRQTANRAVGSLVEKGIIIKEVDRIENGRFPRVLKIADHFILPWHKDPNNPADYYRAQKSKR